MATGRSVVMLGGCRTAFARAWTDLRSHDVLDLARIAAAEAVQRVDVAPRDLGLVVMGAVLPPAFAPNVGREVVLACGWPAAIPGVAVSQACITSLAAAALAVRAIALGEIDVALAGGAESLSNLPLLFPPDAARAFTDLSRARRWPARMRALARFRPRHFRPDPPRVAERSTGRTMGDHAEEMAKRNGISREAQDDLAFESHLRAGIAWSDGRLAAEVVPVAVAPRLDRWFERDNGVRQPADREALAKLPPVFDRRYGSLTAGNSSPLSDGGAAVVLMAEERARAEGRTPLARIVAFATSANDPEPQLLLGPAYAIPAALDRAGRILGEMDVVEMHEAFAAQVLSVTQALASDRFARDQLARTAAVGEVDPSKLNPTGGSIAIGHPFGATGARLLLQAANELARRGGRYALVSACAAGGLAAAWILERDA